MTILFVILIVIASIVLTLIVLIQNPKGGGLTGNIAGFSNQFMGVKQTTDVLEKGTWIFFAVIAALCLLSTFFISKNTSNRTDEIQKVSNTAPLNTQPVNNSNTTQLPVNQPVQATDSGK
ncbi:MAG: preprotein translocase subunit SecG [Chitinophagaceae bacterium]|jgi:preprotein translocase subunit SecG|nr:preprotein translocase subunit SecG [Chitinophagaceae bacterium]OQY93997.1 MAG: preprotein translocase subunit SecG [Sphingobacteriales bacterium UTBCD1]